MRFLPAGIASVLIWIAAAAAQPGDISIRLLDSPPYREEQLIRAEIRFPATKFVPGEGPPSEQWQFGGLLLDPAGDCGRLDSPCFISMSFGFDKSDPVLRLGYASEPVTVLLNSYLPPLPVGRYRVAVLARKLVLKSRGPMSTTFGYPDPPRLALSNMLEFEVVAATSAWVAQTIASTVAVLSASQPNSLQDYERRRAAAEQLRFLDHPPAWRASLSLMPGEEHILLKGLQASREPVQVCQLMQSRVPAPLQAVSTYYLSAMARICGRAQSPVAPARQQEVQQRLIGEACARLASSVAGKQGESKEIAFQTLLERLQHLRANEPRQPLPEWIPSIKSEFVKTLPSIQNWRRRSLMSQYANTLRSPDIIPLLESELDGWKPGDYYEASHEAIANLYALDPARARARILAELRKDRTWLDTPQLDMLPPAEARITDEELIEALAAAQRAGGWNVQLRMTALAKYASPRALGRIRAIYESQQQACQPELMAYFVRVDPAYADRVFHSHAWDMTAEPPACTVSYFERTPRTAMGPVLERYMSAYLMHRTVLLKNTAARSLGSFGSSAALPALWNAFRYFHEYWKGKQAELERNSEGVGLEVELRNAIARGRNWLTTEPGLRTINALCISERCRYETLQDMSTWQQPLRIEVRGQPPASMGNAVGPYYGIPTLAALKEKLAQFPKGTRFLLHAPGDEAGAAEIRRFAARRGLVVEAR